MRCWAGSRSTGVTTLTRELSGEERKSIAEEDIYFLFDPTDGKLMPAFIQYPAPARTFNSETYTLPLQPMRPQHPDRVADSKRITNGPIVEYKPDENRDWAIHIIHRPEEGNSHEVKFVVDAPHKYKGEYITAHLNLEGESEGFNRNGELCETCEKFFAVLGHEPICFEQRGANLKVPDWGSTFETITVKLQESGFFPADTAGGAG